MGEGPGGAGFLRGRFRSNLAGMRDLEKPIYRQASNRAEISRTTARKIAPCVGQFWDTEIGKQRYKPV